MREQRSDRGRAVFVWTLVALLMLALLACRGPSLPESAAPTPTPGGPAMRTALPAPADTAVAATVPTEPGNGAAGTSTPASDASGVAADASRPPKESTPPGGNAPITVRIKVITGQSPSVDVEATGSDNATSTPLTRQETDAGGAVVEVVVELDLGEAGNTVVYGRDGSSLAGAAPPRPRETPFPPVTVGAGPGDARRGQDLFATRGCSGCHSIGTNTIIGPGLAGVADRAGAEAYITESIRNPAVFVVPGFANDMPPFTTLTDQQVKDLFEYLKTLK